MTDHTSISFANLDAQSDGVVVVFAEEGPKLTESAKAFDKKAQGLLTKAMKMTEFKGKKDSSVDLLAPANLDCSRIVLAGLGKPDELNLEEWLNLGGKVRGAVTGKEAPAAHIFLQAVDAEISPEAVGSFALGTILRAYSFKKYKSKKNASDDGKKRPEKSLRKIVIHCADPRGAQRAFAKERAVGRGVNFARDLVNEPANVLTPQEFAKRARTLAKLGVEVEVFSEQRLKRLGMNALLAVGQGSTQPSQVVVMQWNGAGEKGGAPIAFVGKGVVFDAGGISLKPAAGMEDMKGDMAGAACVVGLMHELAERKAKVNAVGIIGVVENMPDGNAQRPGDVVEAMSGTTIEVLNTDAEGRMVLADCLWYTQDRFKPKAMINLATLTGAVMVALGKEHAGLFSNSDELCEELIKAGQETGERLWRLPLGPKYDKMIDSKVADIKNTGGRWGGSISAAQFLQRFVRPETRWAHLDIAGMGMGSPETDTNRSWGSGFGVRLLDRLVRDNYEK